MKQLASHHLVVADLHQLAVLDDDVAEVGNRDLLFLDELPGMFIGIGVIWQGLITDFQDVRVLEGLPAQQQGPAFP